MAPDGRPSAGIPLEKPTIRRAQTLDEQLRRVTGQRHRAGTRDCMSTERPVSLLVALDSGLSPRRHQLAPDWLPDGTLAATGATRDRCCRVLFRAHGFQQLNHGGLPVWFSPEALQQLRNLSAAANPFLSTFRSVMLRCLIPSVRFLENLSAAARSAAIPTPAESEPAPIRASKVKISMFPGGPTLAKG
jgi:hypothetical protein